MAGTTRTTRSTAANLSTRSAPAKAREIVQIIESPRHAPAVRQFLTSHVDHLTSVEAGTLAWCRTYIVNEIGPVLRYTPLTALTRDDVARWINGLASTKNGRGTLQSGKTWPTSTASSPPLQLRDIDAGTGKFRITKTWKTARADTSSAHRRRKSVRTIDVPKRVLAQLDLTGQWVFTNSGRGSGDVDGPARIHNFQPNVWQPALKRAAEVCLEKRPRVHHLRVLAHPRWPSAARRARAPRSRIHQHDGVGVHPPRPVIRPGQRRRHRRHAHR